MPPGLDADASWYPSTIQSVTSGVQFNNDKYQADENIDAQCASHERAIMPRSAPHDSMALGSDHVIRDFVPSMTS